MLAVNSSPLSLGEAFTLCKAQPSLLTVIVPRRPLKVLPRIGWNEIT